MRMQQDHAGKDQVESIHIEIHPLRDIRLHKFVCGGMRRGRRCTRRCNRLAVDIETGYASVRTHAFGEQGHCAAAAAADVQYVSAKNRPAVLKRLPSSAFPSASLQNLPLILAMRARKQIVLCHVVATISRSRIASDNSIALRFDDHCDDHRDDNCFNLNAERRGTAVPSVHERGGDWRASRDRRPESLVEDAGLVLGVMQESRTATPNLEERHWSNRVNNSALPQAATACGWRMPAAVPARP